MGHTDVELDIVRIAIELWGSSAWHAHRRKSKTYGFSGLRDGHARLLVFGVVVIPFPKGCKRLETKESPGVCRYIRPMPEVGAPGHT